MRITHIITDLDTGGAEIMLYKLLASLRDETIEFSVITLKNHGVITDRIRALGVKVDTLDIKQGRIPTWKAFVRLIHLIRTFNPNIIQGWMYHGNFAATLIIFFYFLTGKKVKLFWNVRQTLYEIKREKRQTQWLISFSNWLSFFTQIGRAHV